MSSIRRPARMLVRDETPPATMAAPEAPTALYDGHCAFCSREVQRLARLARGRLETESFQEPGVLERFPGLTHEACMEELKLVLADGRVFGGAEAVARALHVGRPVLGTLALAYYMPGVRALCDRAYRAVAKRRYELFGRTPEGCESDACSVHFPDSGRE